MRHFVIGRFVMVRFVCESQNAQKSFQYSEKMTSLLKIDFMYPY
jgi:hypothetical protein